MLNDDMLEFVLYPTLAETIRKGAHDTRDDRNARDAKHKATDGSGQVTQDDLDSQ